MTRPRLLAGATILAALAIAAVATLLTSGNGNPPARTIAPPPTPPPTTRPAPKTKGEDWRKIIQEILDYRHTLYENPDPERLSRIYHESCPCYDEERKTLRDLQRRGWRYEDESIEVKDAKLWARSRREPLVVEVEATVQQSPHVVVDASGQVVDRGPGSEPTKLTYELVRGKDGRWLVSLIFKRSGR